MADNRFDNKSSLRTPLSRVRGLGAAHAGTEHWWHHRLSAVSNVPLVIAFVVIVAKVSGLNYPDAVAFLSRPLVSILLALFVVSITYHMRHGLEIVIEDYLHDPGTKLMATVANTFFAIVIAAVCLFAIARISFGIAL